MKISLIIIVLLSCCTSEVQPNCDISVGQYELAYTKLSGDCTSDPPFKLVYIDEFGHMVADSGCLTTSEVVPTYCKTRYTIQCGKTELLGEFNNEGSEVITYTDGHCSNTYSVSW